MKMRILGFPVRLILCVLIVGITTAFIDGFFSYPVGGVGDVSPSLDPSVRSHTTSSSIAAGHIRSALEGWLATPASAGDLNGDVQGD